MTIAAIPTDKTGGKLFIKDFRQDKDKAFVKMRSTYNDIPFFEVQLFQQDDNCVICGDDGTVLYRFSIDWIKKICA